MINKHQYILISFFLLNFMYCPFLIADDHTNSIGEENIRYVKASSFERGRSKKTNKYVSWPPQNIADNDESSHWCPHLNYAKGEWIQIYYKNMVSISRIGIINGNGHWGRDEFKYDARVKNVLIEFSSGWEKEVELKDNGEMQYFDIDSQDAEFVKLTIVSVYPAQKWGHVCLSEVSAFSK